MDMARRQTLHNIAQELREQCTDSLHSFMQEESDLEAICTAGEIAGDVETLLAQLEQGNMELVELMVSMEDELTELRADIPSTLANAMFVWREGQQDSGRWEDLLVHLEVKKR